MKNRLITISILIGIIWIASTSCQTQIKKSSNESIEKSFLEEISIAQMQQDYRQGKYTITDAVKEYLERIAAIRSKWPATKFHHTDKS